MSIPEIVEHIYTSENPETGNLPPNTFAWAIFEHGTVFLTLPDEETPKDCTVELLTQTAKRELEQLGYPMGGTPSADFEVGRLAWFADSFVYIVTYNSGHIFNIQTYTEETETVSVGILGRSVRAQDVESPKVVLVRDFAGKQTVVS